MDGENPRQRVTSELSQQQAGMHRNAKGWRNGAGSLPSAIDLFLFAFPEPTWVSPSPDLVEILFIFQSCEILQRNSNKFLFSFFWMCGILVPGQGLNPYPLRWEHSLKRWTTGSPRFFSFCFVFLIVHVFSKDYYYGCHYFCLVIFSCGLLK